MCNIRKLLSASMLLIGVITPVCAGDVTVTWIKVTRAGDVVIESPIGPGGNINNCPGVMVKIRVSGVPEGGTLTSVSITERDFATPDDPLGSVPVHPTGDGTFESDTMPPPNQTDDPGEFAEVDATANVTNEDGSMTAATSGEVNIRESCNMEDSSVSTTITTTSAGGSVQASGAVAGSGGMAMGTGGISSNVESVNVEKKIETNKAGIVDPVVTVQLVIESGPPEWAQWLTLQPSTFVLEPGQEQSVNLIIPPTTPVGVGIIHTVRTTDPMTGVNESDSMWLVVCQRLGDGNNDGIVDVNDLTIVVNALLNPDCNSDTMCLCWMDMNSDKHVDGLDIAPFIDRIIE